MTKPIPVVGEPVPPIVDGGMLHIAKASIGIATTNDVVMTGEIAATPIFTVAAGTIVYDLLAKVVTAFTASAALTIGDSDDVDGYMAVTELVSTVISSELRTSKGSTALTAVYQFGKIYAAEQTIDVTAGATFAVGQADVYLVYSRVG